MQALVILGMAIWQREAIWLAIDEITPGNRAVTKVEDFLEASPNENHFLIRIEEKSGTPDPAKSPYANCLGICLATLHDGEEFSEEFLLALPAFVDRVDTGYRELSPQSILVANLVPFEEAPKEIVRFQTSDDIGRFGLPLFFANDLLAVTKAIPNNAWEELSLESRLPEPEKSKPEGGFSRESDFELNTDAIAKRMKEARREIETKLEHFSGNWDAWYSEAAEVRRRHVEGARDSGGSYFGWGSHFYGPRFSLGYEKTAAYGAKAPSISSLMALHQDLEGRGIHLIAVPLPMRDEVAALRAVPRDQPRFGVLSPERQRILADLLDGGVDVVDVLPWIAEGPEDQLPYFDCGDHHIAPASTVLIAEHLADLLEGYGFPRDPAVTIRRETRSFRVPENADSAFRKNSVYAATTLMQSSSSLPKYPEVFLAGDCHSAFPDPWKHSNANLHDHLSWELGGNTGFLWFYGAGGKIHHHLRRHWSQVEDCRVLIFVFDSSYFTNQTQWETFRGDENDRVPVYDRSPLFPE